MKGKSDKVSNQEIILFKIRLFLLVFVCFFNFPLQVSKRTLPTSVRE